MELKSYWDVGAWAVCYGNRGYKNQVATEEECSKMLNNRILEIEKYIDKIHTVEFTNKQKAALISLHYNVKNPVHVTWRINERYSEKSITNVWSEYVKSEGKLLQGLVKRRQEEIALYTRDTNY